MQGAVAAHIVLELLQTAALLLQLPVQAARRNVQQLRQTGRRVRALRVGRQRLAHTLHQRLGRPVGLDLYGQRTLQHGVECGFIPQHG